MIEEDASGDAGPSGVRWREWRRSSLRVLLGFVPAFALCWVYRFDLATRLLAPTARAAFAVWPTPMWQGVPPWPYCWEAAVVGALLLTSPWGYFQLWRTTVRAADPRGRRLATAFVTLSMAAAYVATCLAVWVVAPATVVALLSFEELGHSYSIASALLRFIGSMIAVVVVALQAPIALALAVASRRADWPRT